MNLDGDTIALLGAIIAGAIAWGSERQARRDLGQRHAELAAELRPRITLCEAAQAVSTTDHGTLEERMRGLKEQLDRIEGMLMAPPTRKRTR